MTGSPRPLLVLLHAFPLDHTAWEDVAAIVSREGWEVITPDLRGFGRARHGPEGPGDEPSLGAMARDVLAILDRIGTRPVVLGGLSMGGYVAMELLRQAPDRVDALVLADTKASADDEPARRNRLRIAEQVLAAGGTEALAQAMVPNLLGRTSLSRRSQVVDRVRRLVETVDPRAVAWAQRAMAARPDSRAALAGFSGPALVVWGEQDQLSSRAEQDLMVQLLAQGQLATISEAGHLAAMEAPDEVAAVVLRFLDGLPGLRRSGTG